MKFNRYLVRQFNQRASHLALWGLLGLCLGQTGDAGICASHSQDAVGDHSRLPKGTPVIPDEFEQGTGIIVGYNASEYVMVQQEETRKNSKVRYDSLAMTEGKLNGIAVGARVILDSFTRDTGTVVGINFKRKLYVVEADVDAEFDPESGWPEKSDPPVADYSAEASAPPTATLATLHVASHSVSSRVSLAVPVEASEEHSTRVTRNFRAKLETIALTEGTLKGIAVGDRVVPDSIHFSQGFGTVVGINPHTQTFVVRVEGGSDHKNYRFQRESLF